MIMNRLFLMVYLAALPGLSFGALIDRGGGLIYDTDLDITWLRDANYSMTSGYDISGRMTWYEATDWVNSLTYYDSVRDVSYDDWRLPATLQPDPTCRYQNTHNGVTQSTGPDCTGSEMGHLNYIELEHTGSAVHDFSPFINVVESAYWSGTEFGSWEAWYFAFNNHDQNRAVKESQFWVWPVRDGDVIAATSEVPIPAAAWLFVSGLLGVLGIRRKPLH